MTRRTRTPLTLFAVPLVVVCVAALAAGAGASHNSFQHLSLGPNGGNAAVTSQWLDASDDGTRVLIRTKDPLVASDTDAELDIYQRRADGVTTLLSPGTYPVGAVYGGSSDDGTTVLFTTLDNLDPNDTDDCPAEDQGITPCGDVYMWANGAISLVSTGPVGGNGSYGVVFEDVSGDGARALFTTREQLVASDTDDARDIYQRSGGTTAHVTIGGNADVEPTYRGSSDDGTRVFFTAEESLVAADTDSAGDVYLRSGGTTTLLSTGPAGGNGAQDASFRGASSDGTRVLIETAESLVAADTDGAIDVYERLGGATTLLSTGPAGGNGAHDAFAKAWSAGATRVFLETGEQLVGSDSDSRLDVYERSGGTTSLLSTGPAGGNGPFDALLQDVSDTGARVVIGTAEALVAGDTDGRIDLYERSGGTTSLLSTGTAGGNGPFDAFFSGASNDGGRVFFETAEPLAGDTDAFPDVYERQGGVTTRISTGPSGGNGAQAAYFTGVADDGARVWFATAEKLASTDTDAGTDIYEARPTASYVRPGGAAYLDASLVIAYRPCTSPNRVHGPPPLQGADPEPSCNPPQPASDRLTVGTGESNGLPVKARGRVSFKASLGDPGTSADEADVVLHMEINDVRLRTGLGDYGGELQVNAPLTLVDKYNGSSPVDPGTTSTFTMQFTVPCATTTDPSVGSNCILDTTADALLPGMVIESKRTIWQLGQVEVMDGGADGVASTTPNTTFLRQGIFVP